MHRMESEDMLLLGAVALGGFAIWKTFSDGGVAKTTDAVGDVAQSASGLLSDTIDSARIIPQIIQNSDTIYKETVRDVWRDARDDYRYTVDAVAGSARGLFGVTYPVAQTAMVQRLGASPTQALKFYASTINPALVQANKPSTKAATIAKSIVTTTPASIAYNSVKRVVGAVKGKIFSSGSSVKSTGASGKYRKY